MSGQSYKNPVTGALVAATFLIAMASSVTAQTGRVTEVFLKADSPTNAGPCPVAVHFRGYVRTDGPATVKYTFTRSDGAPAPAYELTFKQPGLRPLDVTWRLGDARSPSSYEGWQAVKILSPNELESNHTTGFFRLACSGPSRPPVAPVPTVLALFRGTNYGASEPQRAILVVVPSGTVTHDGVSVTNIDQLRSELDWLHSSASFLPGLDSLRDALSHTADSGALSKLVVADSIENLGTITWEQPGVFNPSPLNAEDIFRSLIFAGAPGKQATFFNERAFRVGQGSFVLTIGAGGVARVPVLAAGDEPDSFRTHAAPAVDGGTVTVTHNPEGQYQAYASACWGLDYFHHVNTFGCEMSSLRFVP